MPVTLTMPALSPTMTEGTIARWLKKEGDRIEPGEVIAEIETDKATMEFEAVDEGILGRILVREGGTAKVGEPIAILLAEGESLEAVGARTAPAAAASAQAAATPPAAAAQPAAPAAAAALQPAAPAPSAAPQQPPAVSAPAAATVAPPLPRADGGRIFATPLARRMAKEAGIDLQQLRGSGPHGRITKADVERAIAGLQRATAAPAAEAVPVAAPVPPAAPAAAGPLPVPEELLRPAPFMEYEEVPLTSVRRTIARRLTEAKQFIPHFYVTVDCRMDRLLEMRAELNGRLSPEERITVNDFIIKATALAIRRIPDVNASFGGDRIYRYKSIDISVAVATPTGLITPIVRRADEKGLSTIAREMRDLGARAREGKLKPEEYQGGSFSISNLGMYGVREFAAIINPPQACILAVGTAEKRPVVQDDRIAIATLMTVTLSVDHRVVDGARAAEFLQAFRQLIEDPLQLLL